ncbi:TonB-dependent receptor [soil metagenome]
MHHATPRSILSLAVLAAFGSTLHAQTAPAADAGKGVTTLPTVTVTSSADASAGGLKPPYAGGQVARGGRVGILGSQDIMDTPFSITNYTQQLIQDQQAASIGDVLLNDPAVRVARGFGNYQQTYFVRGLPVFSDDMAYNGLYGLLPRQYLAAELVERVEVLRGASAFLNGAAPGGSGLGGAINVVPKRAPNRSLDEVTLGVDSGGQTYAAADIARRFGPDKSTGVRLNLARRDGDTPVDQAKRELTLASIGLDFHTGNFRVSADVGYQNQKLKDNQPSVTITSGPIPSAPDAKRNLGQTWNFSNERDTFGTVRAEYDVARDWTVWGAYGLRNGHEATDLSNPNADAAGNLNYLRFAGTREDRIRTGEVGIRGQFKTGDIGHTVVFSAATYRGKTDAPSQFANFAGVTAGTLTNPVAIPAPALDAFVYQTKSDTKTQSYAVSDTVSLLQDALRVTLGARSQSFKDDAAGYDESKVTPVFGVVYKVSKAVSVYGSYVEGLVKGDIAPVGFGFPAQPVVNPGQVFKPYQTKQSEVGLKLDLGRFGASLSLYDARKPTYAVDPATLVFGQTDKVTNRGMELTVFGEAMPGLRVLGGGGYTRAKVASTGLQSIGVPKFQMNLGAEWDVPAVPGLALTSRVMYTGKQYADSANTQQVPSWTTLGIGARYAMEIGGQDFTLRARLDNVTNRNYWASAGGYPGAGYLTLGDPRTFTVSGTLSF